MYMHHYQQFDQIGIFTKIYGNISNKSSPNRYLATLLGSLKNVKLKV